MDGQTNIVKIGIVRPAPTPEKSNLSWCAPLLTLIVGIGLILGGYFWGEAINSFTDAGPLSLFILSGMVLAVAFMCAMRKKPKEQNINANLVRDLDVFEGNNPNTNLNFSVNPQPSGVVTPNNTCIFDHVHIDLFKNIGQHSSSLIISLSNSKAPQVVPTPNCRVIHHKTTVETYVDVRSLLIEARREGGSFKAIDDARKSGSKVVIVCPDEQGEAICLFYLTEYLHCLTKRTREFCFSYIKSKRPNASVSELQIQTYGSACLLFLKQQEQHGH